MQVVEAIRSVQNEKNKRFEDQALHRREGQKNGEVAAIELGRNSEETGITRNKCGETFKKGKVVSRVKGSERSGEMKTEALPLYLGNSNEEITDDIFRAVSGRWIRRGRDQVAEYMGCEPRDT